VSGFLLQSWPVFMGSLPVNRERDARASTAREASVFVRIQPGCVPFPDDGNIEVVAHHSASSRADRYGYGTPRAGHEAAL